MRRRIAWSAALACVALLMAPAPSKAQPAPASGAFQSDLPKGQPVPWTGIPKSQPDDIRFAVVGDNTGLARPGVFEQAMNQISWLHPEFVIAVGDLIEGYTDDKQELNREWDHIDQSVAKLGVPFFFVPGNHDLGGDASLDVWRQRKGRPYYAFMYKGALFLCLDTEDPPMAMPPKMETRFHAIVDQIHKDPVGTLARMRSRLVEANAKRAAAAKGKSSSKAEENAFGGLLNSSRISDAQLAFVRRTLAAHKDARWTFVFMHKPGWRIDTGNFAKIEAMLADRPYTMIAGHYHYYSHEVRHGRDYIMMGTTGAVSHQQGPGEMDHLAWITLTSKGPHIANIKLTGLLDKTGKSGQTLAR